MKPLATLKHLSSKNADYGVAEQYLTFEHDEFTGKPILDENGRLVPRQDYRISSLNRGEEDFAVACMRANLRYGKNQQREDVKSHHYILSFDPRDGPDHGLTKNSDTLLSASFPFCFTAFTISEPFFTEQQEKLQFHTVIRMIKRQPSDVLF